VKEGSRFGGKGQTLAKDCLKQKRVDRKNCPTPWTGLTGTPEGESPLKTLQESLRLSTGTSPQGRSHGSNAGKGEGGERRIDEGKRETTK